MPAPAPTFGTILRRERISAGLSVAQLAERSGLLAATLRMYEAGTRQPGWAAAVAIADALGLSTDVFRNKS